MIQEMSLGEAYEIVECTESFWVRVFRDGDWRSPFRLSKLKDSKGIRLSFFIPWVQLTEEQTYPPDTLVRLELKR